MNAIVVVGSNSFSGASFVDFALQQGVRVIGTSRSEEPISAFLPYEWHDHLNFSFHNLDLNKDLAEITTLINDTKPEYVVNFAAQSMVGESWQNPGDWFMTNTVSTIKLHDQLRFDHLIRVWGSWLEISPHPTSVTALAIPKHGLA